MVPQTTADKVEIDELLAHYARAVDAKNWDLWRSVFTADAHIDCTSATGIVNPPAKPA
jgi:3-phenylpropionate/cinnamic acid dioxygenase small subunit